MTESTVTARTASTPRRGWPAWVGMLVSVVLGGIPGVLLWLLHRTTGNARVRDIAGTLMVFACLIQLTFVMILGEKFLENFKSH